MGKNPPNITVIVPTFNRAQYLAECLDSILAQTLPAAQIIVINDGSKDRTKDICDSYRGKIEYYELNQVGKPSAINYGLKKAKGEYIWIFDDDDVALPEALERFVEPLEKNPEYGFSYSTFYFTSSGADDRLGPINFELRIPDLEARGFLIPLLEANFLGGAALFARAACYRAVGDFDPALLRSQDYEMAVRIARRFPGVRVAGPATFHYRQHAGERGATQDRFTVDFRDRKWLEYNQKFFRKFYQEFPLTDYLPPGYPPDKKKRQAFLQRLAIMSYKLLLPEAIKDLRQLAATNDPAPISAEEYFIIREMMLRVPRHEAGAIYDHMEFFDEIRRLASASPVMRLLRGKFVRALLARFRNRLEFLQLPGTFWRIVRLYI